MTLLRKSPLLVIFCEFIRFLTIFFTQHFLKTRNSRQEVFSKRGVVRIFAKLTGKHLCRVSFLIKLQVSDLQLIKKETLAQVFSSEFCEHLFLQNTSGGCFLKTTPRIYNLNNLSDSWYYENTRYKNFKDNYQCLTRCYRGIWETNILFFKELQDVLNKLIELDFFKRKGNPLKAKNPIRFPWDNPPWKD